MCERNFIGYIACKHIALRRKDPVYPCQKARGGRVVAMCEALTDFVDEEGGFCNRCIAELKQRLERLRWMQENGWEWVLTNKEYPEDEED